MANSCTWLLIAKGDANVNGPLEGLYPFFCYS